MKLEEQVFCHVDPATEGRRERGLFRALSAAEAEDVLPNREDQEGAEEAANDSGEHDLRSLEIWHVIPPSKEFRKRSGRKCFQLGDGPMALNPGSLHSENIVLGQSKSQVVEIEALPHVVDFLEGACELGWRRDKISPTVEEPFEGDP